MELLVFIPLLALLAAFGLFWLEHLSQSESAEVARNVAEIRASHEPEEAKVLEEAYLRHVARQFAACQVTPNIDQWLDETENTPGSREAGVPVFVSVSCRSNHLDWAASGSSVIGERQEASDSQGAAPAEEKGCGDVLC